MKPDLSVRERWFLALMATALLTVSYVDRQTLAVLAPTVTRALGISDAHYGWLISAFSMAYLVGAPLGGWVIDRVGARRGLLGAFLIWTAIAGLHAVVPGFAALFGLRIALGVAESPSFPGAAQTVYRSLSGADRARGLGFLFTGSSIGAMVAPPLASYLESRFGWRVAFLTSAIAGVIWLPFWVGATFRRRARIVLDSSEEVAQPKAQVGEVLRNPGVIRGLVLILACAPAISFVLLWGAKFFAQVYHLNQMGIGRRLWVPALTYDLGAVGFGELLARYRVRTSRSGSPRALVALAGALCASLAALAWTEDVTAAVAVASIAMAGGGGLYTLLTADMLSRVPSNAVAVTGGVCAATQSLAYVVANPLIGAVVQRSGGYGSVLLALACWVVPGCAVWLAWNPSPRGAVVDAAV